MAVDRSNGKPTADAACILAIDQGTTSSRAIVFSCTGEIVAVAQEEFPQIYPADGWVEHDPEVLWSTSISTARQVLAAARAAGRTLVSIGIANQRETAVVWDRRSGAPIHRAIVWQDRRTAEICARLEAQGFGAEVSARTGLRLDPYFSATKFAWILDAVPGARDAAAAGHLALGTVDSYLIWRLTGGRMHATDATNASRTALFDIRKGRWDPDLCDLFRVPIACLPEVLDCTGSFGSADSAVLGCSLPITGVAGDQQAALIGQACFNAGDVKSTYGTGAFLVLNTGNVLRHSNSRLLATIAYRARGKTCYALEGSILSAGATIQFLRDGLGLISRSQDVEALARSAKDSGGVYVVPAFTGLGAPYWDADARGAIIGLTRATTKAEVARAALDSAAYQTHDLLEAMRADGEQPRMLKVDGGMSANGLLLQRLADVLGVEVIRPAIRETTAFGAACLAAVGCGLLSSLEDDVPLLWRADARAAPDIGADVRRKEIEGWRRAVGRTLSVPVQSERTASSR